MAKFQPGQSGNPAGSAPRHAEIAAIRDDWMIGFPDPSPYERRQLSSLAKLQDKADRCRDGEIAALIVGEVRRGLAVLRRERERRQQRRAPPSVAELLAGGAS